MLNINSRNTVGTLKLIFASIIVLWLAACATPSQMPDSGRPDGVFERTGRFSVNSEEANGHPEAVQGGFSWSDTPQQLTLSLSNPMGTTLARVRVYGDYAVLEHSNGSHETASSADSLVLQALGVPVPVANLRYWMQGQTGSDPVSNMQLGDNSYPAQFNQNGWRVSLSRYDEQGPRLIQLNRHDHQRRISVRLAITQ